MSKMKSRAIFITATDTDVGKTIASFVLGVLLKQKGLDVGVMKPVQCAGQDALFLKKNLQIKDPLAEINPYFAKEPLSPHLAFSRQKVSVDISKIKKQYEQLRGRHDFLIVEGAGGLLVPIKENYLMIDLVKELGLDIVVVSRLGLGAINHSLLTIRQAQSYGIAVRGVIFSEAKKSKRGLVEKTNPQTIEKIGKVPVLGVIPYLSTMTKEEVKKKCAQTITIDPLLEFSPRLEHLALKKDDQHYLWHPFTQMKDWLREDPLIIEEAQGCYLKDLNGTWYLDGISSLWVNVHGHRQPAIDQAVKKQIDRVSHSTLLGLSNVPAIALAKALVQIVPPGLEKVFYSDSGSTAVEIAIKMAYQYWQNIGQKKKKKLIHLSHSYHGDTLGSVSVGGIDLFHKVYRGLIFDTIHWPTPLPDAFGNKKKFKQDFLTSMDRLEKFLQTSHGHVAALVVEPLVQGAAGMIVWPLGILKQMERMCRRYNVLLVADEVATGFGRTGTMFACEQEKVNPDILCLAKGLTGGYLPLAATLTSKKIYEGFLFDYQDQKTFFHGHTYTGNPLACAAALANLNVFKKERVLEKLQGKIKFLKQELKQISTLRHVGDVRQKGLMVGIELVKDRANRIGYEWKEKIGIRVCQCLRTKGIILRPLGSVIVLMPPLSINKNEIKKLISTTYQAIKETTESC